jgi:hypothetical protein
VRDARTSPLDLVVVALEIELNAWRWEVDDHLLCEVVEVDLLELLAHSLGQLRVQVSRDIGQEMGVFHNDHVLLVQRVLPHRVSVDG